MQEVYDNPRTTTNNYLKLAKRANVSENKGQVDLVDPGSVLQVHKCLSDHA